MRPPIDLDAYFARVRYSGPKHPHLDTLRHIHLRHVQSIPFENLNPLLRWPVELDASSLEKKMIHDRRGGYCFEHNSLLKHVLSGLGFNVTGLVARVRWGAADDRVTPRTHMLLLVRLAHSEYIADVGFGGQTLTTPIQLISDLEQPTPHGLYRLLQRDGEWTLQGQFGGEWRSLYQFDLTPQHPADYEVCNWYTSSHPKSHFTKGLGIALAGDGCRYTLQNNELVTRYVDGQSERRALTSGAEIRNALTTTFGINIPQTADLDPILDRLAREQVAL